MPAIKLEDLSVKQLQEELVKLGVPSEDAKKFTTKAPLIATLKALNVKAGQKVATLEPKADPKEEKQVEKKWQSKAERQRAYWGAQPKVRILVPLEGKEKQGIVKWVFNPKTEREEQVYISGAIQPVTENGAKYLVPKGIYVEVPEPVAKVIQDKYQQTSEAGANLLIDRIDPETGRKVSEQL